MASRVLVAALVVAARAQDGLDIPGRTSYNGLALTPQMGFNNWNAFHCNVNETVMLSTARKMVDFGLRDLGYRYIVLDDCWSSGRDKDGRLVPDKTKFPNGIKAMADQIHDLGFKFGMYSSAGTFTCGRYPGSLGHEEIDAQTWASWGVDYLKYDNCFNQGQSGTPKISYDRYNVMSTALNKTGRPIFYAMCNWGQDMPYDWAFQIANSYRMSGDISDNFNRPDPRCPCVEGQYPCNFPGFHCSAMMILNYYAAMPSRSNSGGWADLDMLEVGNGGMDDNEYLTHFSLWALASSPLLIGTNVPTLSPANLAILSNPAVIALNQDPGTSGATRKWRFHVPDKDEFGQGEISLWTREMANGDTVFALLNAGNSSRVMTAAAKDLFLDQATAGTYLPAAELAASWDVHDLWANRMGAAEALAVLNGTAPLLAADANSTSRYNASALSYEAGLEMGHPALFGVKVGTLAPGGSWSAEIPRHGTGLYRLRRRRLRKRDEL